MLMEQVDSRERAFKPIPISYLIRTANQFDCSVFVTSDKHTAGVRQYDEVKNLRMTGFLTFYFKGNGETEVKDRTQRILQEDDKG